MKEIIKDTFAIAFFVNGYVVHAQQQPVPQVKYGDVVKLTFHCSSCNYYDQQPIERLALVLIADKKKYGCFEALILPCPYDCDAPNERQSMSFPKRCAEIVDNGVSVKEMLGDSISGKSREFDERPAVREEDVPF